MKLTLSSIACLFVSASSLDKYAFVSDQTCEAYGMESIHDAAVCEEAASHLAGTNGIRSDYKFIDVTDWKGPGRPNGCSYHRFGNVEQWHHGYDEDCTVNGFAGCFCKVVPYEFVSDKNCEDYGMESIYDPAECKAAASQLAGTNGIRPDYKFIDVTGYKGPGRPKGCSYHRFGNVEQWHHGYDEECTVNGFAGCFCKPVADRLYYSAEDQEKILRMSRSDADQEGEDRLYSGQIKFDGNIRIFTWDRNDGEACTGSTACKSHCCDPNWRSETGKTCQAKKRDWAGVPYCPSECRGAPFAPLGSC